MPELGPLSKRESEILGLAAQGLLDKEIVDVLGISVNTIRTYWTRIRRKLGDGTRTGLAAVWMEAERGRESTVDTQQYLQRTWEIDVASGILTLTPESGKFIGLDGKSTLTPEQYAQTIHPDERERVMDALASEIASDHDSYSLSFRVLSSDGPRLIHASGMIDRSSDGTAIRIRGFTFDATNCRSGVLEDVTVGLWRYEPESGRIEGDSDFYRILQISPGEASLKSLLGKLEPAVHYRILVGALRSAIQLSDRFTTTFRRQDGGDVRLDVLMIRKDGKIVQVQGSVLHNSG